jgi:hypothetical protein
MKLQWWLLLFAVSAVAMAQEETKEPPAPPVLSRGVGPGMLRSATDSVPIRFYANISGIYETGLTPLSMDANGEIPNDSSYGVEAGIGAYGFHRWKRTLLGLDYRGTFYHYPTNTYYDGSDHALSLGVSHQATKRTYFTFRQSAGTTSRDILPYSPYSFTTPIYGQMPTQELFNNRTYYLNSMGDFTWRKSSRLSFNLGGSLSAVGRHSNGLVSEMTEQARGDMMYRLGRSHTIGIDYGFSHYSYSQNYGAAFMHTGALNYAAKLGKSWTFSLRGGIMSVDTQGLIRVAIDPVIAAIIGRPYGVEFYRRQNLIPTGGATLQRHFRKSSVSFSYSDGATPGNGVYLASRQRTAGAYYSYTGIYRWNFGASFDYTQYSTLSRNLENYKGYGGGVGASRALAHGLHFTSRLDTRQYEMYGSGFARGTYRIAIGLAYSSGEGPLAIW